MPRDAIFDSEVKDGDKKGKAIDNTILDAQETVLDAKVIYQVVAKIPRSGKSEPTEVAKMQQFPPPAQRVNTKNSE